ncbi:MAG: homocysteine S-methyltransferase family protein, partial [Candidatus Omnitrophota bacterium]
MIDTLREKIKKELVLLDGAFGTYAQSLGLSDEYFGGRAGCMEYLSISRPDFISRIHRDYLDAGSDAVETNTFGGNALKLAEYGLKGQVYDINLESARLARAAADEFSVPSRGRYVIGSMGPTGKLPSSTDPVLGAISYAELKNIFFEQALGIIDGGADALIIETGQDLLEMKAALTGAKAALKDRRKDLVLMAQCTLANNGRMLLGTEISAVSAVMGYLGADVIGINCSTGPVEMENVISWLGENCPAYVSCVPNAGLPFEVDGRTEYPLAPRDMADIVARFVEKYRIDVVGGCCGTTPEHIRLIGETIEGYRKKKIYAKPFYSSFYRGFNLDDVK